MSKKIKIAIDVSPLNDGNSVRGVGFYTKNLVSSLQKEVKNNPKYKNWEVDLITNIHDLQSTIYDLIHYPYFDPFQLTLPSQKRIPTIITVHDLIPRQFKEHFPVGIKGEIKWLIQKNRAKKADYIITVSNYSKHIIKSFFSYPEDKIFVTHLAANSIFKPINDPKKLNDIKIKYQLPDKFILFIGDINWNKNIPNLVTACKQLNYPLVIAGSAATRKNVEKHPWNQDLIWLQQQKINNLVLTGFIPDEELPYIYNLATIYCQPSFAEGFGLPPLEAMQSNCPVAYSNKTSLKEIMDCNGLPFDPYSVKDIQKALETLWTDQELREKYKKMGIKRAKSFNWSYTAKQTLAVYELAINYEK